MRKIINSTFITLDDIIENPQGWPGGEPDDRAGPVHMGRHTNGVFTAAFSAQADEHTAPIPAIKCLTRAAALTATTMQHFPALVGASAPNCVATQPDPVEPVVRDGGL